MIFLVATSVFMILHVVPGDPVEVMLSADGMEPDPQAVAEMRSRLGLDQPLHQQYVNYLSRLSRGDLGRSFQDDEDVLGNIAQRLPRTLELIGMATLLSLIVGIPLGVLAARKRGTWIDRILGGATSFALSIPTFVLGTVFVLVFALMLRLVPAGGFVPFSVSPRTHLILLLMPSAAIAVGFSAVIIRMTRSTVLDVLQQDWVRTARAKGLQERRVLRRHVVRNALGPVLTVTGLQMGTMLGGTVLVEYIFNWPGMSGFLVRAVESRDYPEVQGIVLVTASLFILLNLIVDVLYSLLDPRVRKS
ncbi:peptide/nickel transport system permease protein [Rhizobium sp. BK077]|nr:peptide/nickel transport system permease protein [Rhizobium sp. BK112]MBB3372521.1 peptide/nickel transport system permease protein [Rhizobium sp. BK077]MBB4183293.1 peptide/nickel transport system permease protein [Rhizobium sp. BK109]MBB4255969.1 peptide/nickel transport system permease protein [Rhizobium sp. BK008]